VGRTAESQTPHVAPGARRQLSLTPAPRTEDPFHTRRTNAAAFRIRGAFHRRIPSASLLAGARRETCRAATGTLGFAAVAQLPTRVCKHCCQLDLRTEPAIRRSTHATCRPFDFYSCVELRAQPRTHRLRCMLQATEVACAATAVPLAGTRRPGRSSSGVVLVCLERQNDAPPRRPYVERGFTPTCLDPDIPMSLVDACHDLEKDRACDGTEPREGLSRCHRGFGLS
jgi:hypothetical protein